jgi:DNA-binding GntR family transcriptional regulator
MNLVESPSPLRTAITDRTYDLLRAMIVDSELSPGDRLKIEHLSKHFNVSQTPVREALNRLAAEGLVTQEAYRGFRVSQLLDHVELVQLQSAREVIEVAAVDAISMPRVLAALPKLKALVDEMGSLASEPTLNIRAFNAADAEFHRLTVAAANNRFLLEAFDALHVHVQIARHYQGKSVDEAITSNEEHRKIVSLLEAGDGSVASGVVRQHIRGVADRLAFGAEEREFAR